MVVYRDYRNYFNVAYCHSSTINNTFFEAVSLFSFQVFFFWWLNFRSFQISYFLLWCIELRIRSMGFIFVLFTRMLMVSWLNSWMQPIVTLLNTKAATICKMGLFALSLSPFLSLFSLFLCFSSSCHALEHSKCPGVLALFHSTQSPSCSISMSASPGFAILSLPYMCVCGYNSLVRYTVLFIALSQMSGWKKKSIFQFTLTIPMCLTS